MTWDTAAASSLESTNPIWGGHKTHSQNQEYEHTKKNGCVFYGKLYLGMNVQDRDKVILYQTHLGVPATSIVEYRK